MKSFIVFCFLSLYSHTGNSQQTFEPQLLILTPAQPIYPNNLQKDITRINKAYDSAFEEKEKLLASDEYKDSPPNIQQMQLNETEYLKDFTVQKLASMISQQYLAYRFYEKFPELLILLSNKTSSGSLSELNAISREVNLQYVLNFPRLSFYKKDDAIYSSLSLQLYDRLQNRLLIDSTFTGNWNNPGFEFTCEDSTIECTISNALASALNLVIYKIADNSPKLKQERQLFADRSVLLKTDYFNRPFDKTFLINILSSDTTNIRTEHLYQLLVNEEKDKFVGFFLEPRSRQTFRQLNENNNDKAVTILTDKNISDSNYLSDFPELYAYIVKGVRYKGKWYFEKSAVTYFEANDLPDGRFKYFNNLQNWGFFKTGTSELSPDFWEENLFEKIVDLTKDPDWSRYGKTIWKTEEEENRSYIGMYKIVADQLKTGKSTPEPKRIRIQ